MHSSVILSLSNLNKCENKDQLQSTDHKKNPQPPIIKINYEETEILNLRQQIEYLKKDNEYLKLE